MLKERVFPNYKNRSESFDCALSSLLTHVVCMKTYIITFSPQWLRKTGFDINVMVGLGCCCFHTQKC